MIPIRRLILLIGLLTLLPLRGGAQPRTADIVPRSQLDSTFAIALVIDRWLERVKAATATHDSDAVLTAAITRLQSVAQQRHRKPPIPMLGSLWDLQMHSLTYEPLGRDRVNVQGVLDLATDSGTSAPFAMVFERSGTTWRMISHSNVVEQFAAIAARLADGTSK